MRVSSNKVKKKKKKKMNKSCIQHYKTTTIRINTVTWKQTVGDTAAVAQTSQSQSLQQLFKNMADYGPCSCQGPKIIESKKEFVCAQKWGLIKVWQYLLKGLHWLLSSLLQIFPSEVGRFTFWAPA